MNYVTRHRTRGFTLVELLTVIAIIGILAAILIPAVGAVQSIARRSTASSDARQIALAYNTFANSGGRPRNITNSSGDTYGAGNVGEFAGILAKRGGLNEAGVYYIASDPELAADINRLAEIKQVLDDPRADAKTAHNLTVTPRSWAVAVNLPVNAEASSTPLVWTRGLSSSGVWDADSPWEGDGGHIAFLDGHASWYEDLADDPLVNHRGSGGTTTDINNAIHSSGDILED
jgi:prepilin-type N-terminal cleavage/methylation domain-containing protein/prepilin-type processing-associated H-X9-DG protein